MIRIYIINQQVLFLCGKLMECIHLIFYQLVYNIILCYRIKLFYYQVNHSLVNDYEYYEKLFIILINELIILVYH
jgi:hypothetical protein